ncbi:oxidoreductase [Chryseobacterium sp. Leaf180]|uniref:SDR family NAD(P)-dependent oxidoreductase n=1 Tax=Chryseobacterium sp. Leaf180 TaxID=1736289 RepID=UPI00070107D9|nr:SDR family oxidoreductase [Chryseobacterium sp. Leaf180]KQR94820.1 oxidoreductase [Chryseobacterium sp. Leaf180]
MKNVVIIGCGKGIGLESAKILSKDFNVTGISRSKTAEIENLEIDFHELDILNGNLNEIAFPDVVDGLIYAPGSINLKPFNRLSEEDFKNDFNINVLGAIKTIQKLLPNLKKSESASIVLFSTVAAKIGMPFHSSVAASKSAVEGLVKSLAAEFAMQKIRVNALAPSLTDTSLASQLLSTPEKRESSDKRHPLQRIGKPEEIAELISFLISEKSAWMTGQIIGIDGGMGAVKI